MILTRFLPVDFGVFGGKNLEIIETGEGVFSITERDGNKHIRTKHVTLNALIQLLFQDG